MLGGLISQCPTKIFHITEEVMQRTRQKKSACLKQTLRTFPFKKNPLKLPEVVLYSAKMGFYANLRNQVVKKRSLIKRRQKSSFCFLSVLEGYHVCLLGGLYPVILSLQQTQGLESPQTRNSSWEVEDSSSCPKKALTVLTGRSMTVSWRQEMNMAESGIIKNIIISFSWNHAPQTIYKN